MVLNANSIVNSDPRSENERCFTMSFDSISFPSYRTCAMFRMLSSAIGSLSILSIAGESTESSGGEAGAGKVPSTATE